MFQREFVVLIERLRFLHLESIIGIRNIEPVPHWGDMPEDWKELQAVIKEHIQKTVSPKSSIFVNQFKEMKDNVLQSNILLNQVYEVTSATDNFCQGHPHNINFKLKTYFKDLDAVNKVIDKIYGTKIQEYNIFNQCNNNINNLVDLTIHNQTSNEAMQKVIDLNTTLSDLHEGIESKSLIHATNNSADIDDCNQNIPMDEDSPELIDMCTTTLVKSINDGKDNSDKWETEGISLNLIPQLLRKVEIDY